VIGTGDYLTLDGARWIIEKYCFKKEKEDRLIRTLEFINECRGIAKAKAKLTGEDLDDFKTSLDDLDSICVNPVTIPRKWEIKHIPNLLQAYYDNIYEEQFLTKDEYMYKKFLGEYLS
jgi:hypothetical protein